MTSNHSQTQKDQQTLHNIKRLRGKNLSSPLANERTNKSHGSISQRSTISSMCSHSYRIEGSRGLYHLDRDHASFRPEVIAKGVEKSPFRGGDDVYPLICEATLLPGQVLRRIAREEVEPEDGALERSFS